MNSRINSLENRINNLEYRMNRIEIRLDALDKKLDNRFLWIIGVQITTLVTVILAVVFT
jgi:uncharacterized coiled-coil protein SlyX